MLHLQTSVAVLQQRLSTRTVDPQTALAYYRPPQSSAVAERVVRASHDSSDQVERRAKMHEQAVQLVKRKFALVTFDMDGALDIPDVSRGVQNFIEAAQGWELAQDPSSQEGA